MTCPDCHAEYLRPWRTNGQIRSYTCPFCGHEFQTIERLYHPEARAVALDIVGRFRGQVSEIMETKGEE